MPQDYKNSLNMPKTDFPMRGNSPTTLSFPDRGGSSAHRESAGRAR